MSIVDGSTSDHYALNRATYLCSPNRVTLHAVQSRNLG